ncbi:hypothetical protein HK098_008161 [Nowakowskiella sp. JEL0407]|nr:hypothetical protein HK098_008161 [Nowakowskiella sp. JEL0407]
MKIGCSASSIASRSVFEFRGSWKRLVSCEKKTQKLAKKSFRKWREMEHVHDENCSHTATPFTQNFSEFEFERSIHGLVHSGNFASVSRILQSDNVNSRDSAGYSPLHYASRQGHVEIAKLLISFGANVNSRTCELGTTPLLRAILAKNLNMVELLLKNGADVKIADNYGRTVLHAAAEAGDLNIVSKILDTDDGRSLKFVADRKGNCPWQVAKNDDYRDILKE